MNLPVLATNATNPNVFIHNGKAVTTSQAVATYFNKRHDNVLRALANLECSADFTALNFEVSEYTDITGRKLPMYEMTKDGFVFLVMGFTGKKAAAFKEAYISEFNRMEAELYSGRSKVAQNASQEEIDAYNINVLVKHFNVMFDAWRYQIEPALRSIESPLAGKLHDRFADGSAFLRHIEKSLNNKLLPNQKPRLH